jgi:hypothetical protein
MSDGEDLVGCGCIGFVLGVLFVASWIWAYYHVIIR